MSIREAMPTPKSFALWRISLVSWVVELGKAETASTSRSRPQNVLRSLRRSGPVFRFWTLFLVSWSWTRAHRADVHFNKHPHDLFQVPCGVCFQWFVPERSLSYPEVELGKAEAQAFRVLSARSFWPLASKPRTVFASNRFSSYPDFNISVILCEGVVIFGCYNRED